MFGTTKTNTTQAEVHFHQGPQGQPVPCYDGKKCPSPKLDLAEAQHR